MKVDGTYETFSLLLLSLLVSPLQEHRRPPVIMIKSSGTSGRTALGDYWRQLDPWQSFPTYLGQWRSRPVKFRQHRK
eukprot:768807-Hanusia_phi.AAC.11